jgi:hypothetical protein
MRTVLFTCGLSVALLAAGPALSGDTKPAPQGAPTARQRAAASKAAPSKEAARPAMTDAQLESAIRARFAKSKINADKFQVHVQGGVATIEGRTDVIQHKGTATRMAKTAGAVAVNNHVKASDAAKQKAASNLATGRRRAQIKRGDPRSDPAPPRQRKE